MTTYILWAIGMGIAIGLTIVIAIWIARVIFARVNPTFNSLENIHDFMGCIAEVLVEITPESPGSIRVKKNGATLKLWAMTREQQVFRTGDRVVIVEIQNNQAWITSVE